MALECNHCKWSGDRDEANDEGTCPDCGGTLSLKLS